MLHASVLSSSVCYNGAAAEIALFRILKTKICSMAFIFVIVFALLFFDIALNINGRVAIVSLGLTFFCQFFPLSFITNLGEI